MVIYLLIVVVTIQKEAYQVDKTKAGEVMKELTMLLMYLSRFTEDEEIQTAIGQFTVKYGLFGLITALPTTPSFMDYEAISHY